MQEQRATVGEAHTLGASLTADGVNFAVYSEIAEKVEVCLFDADGSNERRIELPGHTHAVWHGHIAGCKAGDLYGIRVHGPFDPANGLRCNANKLLLDPYAKAIVGPLTWSTAHYAYDVNSEDKDLSVNDEDSAPFMPKCQVVDDSFDWGDDKPPRVPLRDTIYYEAHVKGFTKKHPDIPEDIRGTYAGMGSPKSIEHMKSIGITSVELLPVHAFVQDQRLIEMGLANYWGYNTIGFFAPEPRYAAGNPVTEFKQMVKNLHAAGIEVILDVVYNHTAEGNQLGPTLSFKGIDNPTYYRLSEEDKRYYVDFTGTGNTVNTHHNVALRMIMDSLRYWVTEMHVDGFRFDLASTLGRGHSDFDPRSGFFAAVAQDPLLATVKMVAEPWDVGSTGYQVGGFPTGWAEWNGKYRDALRAFWKGDEGKLAEFSHRLSGSSDLYEHSARGPNDSVNVITVHDGFTLHDLVSYNEKHNEANGEDNKDGESNNHSWNCGAEGPTDDPEINELRERQKRNLLTSLFVSQGTPLLLAGDEMGRTQGGNNNGYCQDDDISWLDWRLPNRDEQAAFVGKIVALRQNEPALRRTTFLTGQEGPDGHKDVLWVKPTGEEMVDEDWTDPGAKVLGELLCGQSTGSLNDDGTPLVGNSVLVLVNAHHEDVPFVLPGHREKHWTAAIDTFGTEGTPEQADWQSGESYPLKARSVAVLTQRSDG